MKCYPFLTLLCCAIFTLLIHGREAHAGVPADFLRVPPGFKAEILVANVPKARSMALGDGGTLFVGTRFGDGTVYAIRDALGEHPQVTQFVQGLKVPNGVAFRDGALYVAEPQRILRFPQAEQQSAVPRVPEVVVAQLPYKTVLHAWKYLAFGPDGKLYVPVGAPCNICDEREFGLILRMNPDGSGREVVARGVRNSVGMSWHPQTGELWFTDNGRDMLGDDVPACELNRMPVAGLNFGFPFCHGGDLVDPEFGQLGSCADAQAPVQKLGPHVAPLGVRFYTGVMFPAEYRNQVFIAEHGSWNRSKGVARTGYRIALVRLKGNTAVAYETFAEGWLDGDKVLGRPVDLLVAPDGSLLVSDDERGAIYRISYQPSGA
jgi:glucose/arabinose dehydrogenase